MNVIFTALLLVLAVCYSFADTEFKVTQAVQPRLNDTIISCGAYEADACNCVYYARDRQPKLPTGLTTCDDKKSKVNSHTAAAGCVIFRTGDPTYCHAAYVTKVSSGTVYYDQVRFSLINEQLEYFTNYFLAHLIRPTGLLANALLTPSVPAVVQFLVTGAHKIPGGSLTAWKSDAEK